MSVRRDSWSSTRNTCKAEGNFRHASERFSYMAAFTIEHTERLSSRQLACTRMRVNAQARSGSTSSHAANDGGDGSGSRSSLVAGSNAQPQRLVAQLPHV